MVGFAIGYWKAVNRSADKPTAKVECDLQASKRGPHPSHRRPFFNDTDPEANFDHG
jgi:hypothetical protein